MDREYSVMLSQHEKFFLNEVILTSHWRSANQKPSVISKRGKKMKRRKIKKRRAEDQNPFRGNLGRPIRKPAPPSSGCHAALDAWCQQCPRSSSAARNASLVSRQQARPAAPGAPAGQSGRAQPVHEPLGWAQSRSHAGGQGAQPSCHCFLT